MMTSITTNLVAKLVTHFEAEDLIVNCKIHRNYPLLRAAGPNLKYDHINLTIESSCLDEAFDAITLAQLKYRSHLMRMTYFHYQIESKWIIQVSFAVIP